MTTTTTTTTTPAQFSQIILNERAALRDMRDFALCKESQAIKAILAESSNDEGDVERANEIDGILRKSSNAIIPFLGDGEELNEGYDSEYEMIAPSNPRGKLERLKASESLAEFLDLAASDFDLFGNKGVRLRLRDALRHGTNDSSREVEKDMGEEAEDGEERRRRRAQDKKDIERDIVSIDGRVYVGAEVGYEGVVRALSERLVELWREGGMSTPLSPQESIVTSFAERVIHVANRTTSGGDCYEVMERSLGCESILFAPVGGGEGDDEDRRDKPDSHPLVITLSMGPFSEGSSSIGKTGMVSWWDFGIRAEIVAVSKYAVMDSQTLARGAFVTTEYRRMLGLPLPLRHHHPDSDDEGNDADGGGSVVLRIEV